MVGSDLRKMNHDWSVMFCQNVDDRLSLGILCDLPLLFVFDANIWTTGRHIACK